MEVDLVERPTKRELEIIRAKLKYGTYARVAEAIHLAISTVHWHLSRTYRKLNVRSFDEAVFHLVRQGDIPPDEIIAIMQRESPAEHRPRDSPEIPTSVRSKERR